MTGQSSIVGMRSAEAGTTPPGDVLDEASGAAWDGWEDAPARRPWLATAGATAAVIVSVAWVAFLLHAAWNALPAMAPLALAQFGAAVASVPALAGIVWLLALRTSRAEADRFADTARTMRREAEALGRTVAVLGQAIEDRRAALAEQVQFLTALGDTATQRLASIGRGLSEEIDQADVHARALGDAAGTAHERLDTLLRTLPRAQAEAETIGQRIDAAGLLAGERAAALDAQVVALMARGREAEALAGGAAQKLAAHIDRMEATSASAGARLEEVTSVAEAAVDSLLDRTATAIDESRKAIAAQGEAMMAMVSANQTALDNAARETTTALATRIDILEQVIERIAGRLDAQRETSIELFETLDHGIDASDRRLGELHRTGDARLAQLTATMGALTASAEAMAATLATGDGAARTTIATTESLLIALDAATREMDETLPQSVERLEERAGAARRAVGAIKPELLALVTAAESSHNAVEAIAGVIGEQRLTIEALSDTLMQALSTGRIGAEAIGRALDEANARAERLSHESAPQLIEVIQRVRDTADAAADHAREAIGRVVPEAADALGVASTAALARAMDGKVEARIGDLSAAAGRAADAADEVAAVVAARLAEIDQATARARGALEEVSAIHQEAERENFARQASELVERLHSVSIDLTRSFAPDMSDTAWAAYLKGDRGIFTRRAVRMIDGSDQRDVRALYDEDAAFREQVNRYVHDFEAMLRRILAERDGSALGITLLSSDMGKLYVALAQAIQRLT